jgi:putative spermidine/putrescine transport system ATP-binding protein
MSTMGSAQTISITGLRKSYGSAVVLDGIDLAVRGGEFLTLLGPSGSGKTTLLMVIAGFAGADGGSVRIGGAEALGVPPQKRNLGVVFQNYALFPHMSVAENIAYPLRARRVPGADIRRKVAEALSLVRLSGFDERRIDQLSGGQKQRIALARAVVFEPRILLMDEPLSALDKNLREEMQAEIRALHDRLGVTTVYVTHDQREALTMSDRICVMDRGRIVQLATPRDTYERPASLFVATFIGQSNVIDVHVENGTVSRGSQLLFTTNRDVRGSRKLLLRPEHLVILPHGDETPPGAVALAAGVTRTVYQGESQMIVARLDDGEAIHVLRPAGEPLGPSAGGADGRVRIAFNPAQAALLPPEPS